LAKNILEKIQKIVLPLIGGFAHALTETGWVKIFTHLA
jgi:hypothetical protein